ncbi:alpha/beta hydrolase-fold protein [Corallococcus sp. BB11-1]|uniref:extracellular catalytic domain type 1 short-chain-length polyhydroxyalkanoate depolymerase n=1 Tax=Corallococcus sp. BB11-1 TaxID=2996783 RepID=UPI00226EC1A7|nr:alpha/beta hydrolase-fold protein [Corallococcus sp. BB11-1]MCY1033506.1 alpha/beta hydrolase-fold protein [Corallococcus sp. BB11-1]
MRLRLLALVASSLLMTTAACDSTSDEGPAPSPDAGTQGPGPTEGDVAPADRTACAGLTVAAGTYDWTVEHDGRTRAYRVHVPTGYDATKPTPVVFSFHGFGSNEVEQEALSAFSTLGDTEGFISVYPRGLNFPEIFGQGEPDSRGWNGVACCGPSQVANVDDVGFVDALLADLDTRVCTDPRRVFASGFSNGGFFSYRLACERAQRFAAIAPVAGMQGLADCAPSRPVPVLHFHGSDDPTILYGGGNNIPAGRPYPSAAESVRRFAERNGCTGPDQQTYQQGNATCVAATGCTPESASAVLCTVLGGKHSWPGQTAYNEDTADVNATQEMWRFFQARPRP